MPMQESRHSRIWILMVLLTVAALVAVACDPSDEEEGVPEASSTGSATSPEIEQAKWKVKTRLAPGHRKLSKKQKNRVKKAATPIGDLVTEVYDVLFLAPEDRASIVKARFLAPTATALLRTDTGVARGSSEVRTLRRSADIAIDATTTRLAAVRVTIKARGMNGDKNFTVLHKARLWLEKMKGRWKVIAFRVDQGPRR